MDAASTEYEPLPEIELCYCGCARESHDEDGHGRCRYCFEEDCGGFTLDEESTMLALAFMYLDDVSQVESGI